jgi:hypothetical protein
LLELIRTSLGVGQIYKHGKDSIQLRVSSVKDLQVIIDHFDKYPLITQKLADYLLFKRVSPPPPPRGPRLTQANWGPAGSAAVKRGPAGGGGVTGRRGETSLAPSLN